MSRIAIVSFAIFAALAPLTVLAAAICLMKPILQTENHSVGAAAGNFLNATVLTVQVVDSVQCITVAFVNNSWIRPNKKLLLFFA